jgi:hypothetical protein
MNKKKERKREKKIKKSKKKRFKMKIKHWLLNMIQLYWGEHTFLSLGL